MGISPVSRDFWKRWTKTGPNSVASSFRTLGRSSLGPKALEGFKPLRSLVTPSFETTMSSMKGADLLRNGTSIWSLLLNTSVNWPLNSSDCSISEVVIPVPPLLLRGGMPWLSLFLTIDVPIEVSRFRGPGYDMFQVGGCSRVWPFLERMSTLCGLILENGMVLLYLIDSCIYEGTKSCCIL